jgi:imidazolonepropionase-like amidohydrolase
MLRRVVRACVLLLLIAPAAVAQQSPVAFINAHLIPIAGPEIDRGALVVQDGRIVAVGSMDSVTIPDGAEVIDAAGRVIMPGLVDTHSHIGGPGGGDSSAPMHPEVRVLDSLNPFASGFRRAVAGGVTTMNVMPGSGHLLSGQTIYLKPRGGTTIEDLFIFDDAGAPMGGIKMANGTNPQRNPPFPETRGKAAAIVRAKYIDAQEYMRKVEAADGDPEKMPKRDLGLEALGRALKGEIVVHHHTHRADDIITVLRLSEEFGFRVVLHHTSEAWKVADEIAAAGAPVSAIFIDSPGGKLEASELSYETGKILEEAGALTAFHTDDFITDSRLFFRSAAMAHRAGMSRAGALASLTSAGAQMLDLGDRVGTLEAGKDADFIVLSGDPLSVYTKVLETWIEGERVFDRSNPDDHLYAVGGFGAGNPLRPYLCCIDEAQAAEGAQQ